MLDKADSTALVPVESPPTVILGTLRAGTPDGVLEGAKAIARPLANLIKSQHLAVTISGREYVKCDGWTAMAAMLGITPHEVSVTETDGIFTAIVELRAIVDGRPISRASAECGAPDEFDKRGNPLWANRPRYARRSMALTRATAKAARLAFSWVLVLAGYEPTPLEEMESIGPGPDLEIPKLAGTAVTGDEHLRGEPWHPPGERPPVISPQQRKRLFAVARAAGWSDDAIRAELNDLWGFSRTATITRGQYRAIVEHFEAGPDDRHPQTEGGSGDA